MARHVCTIIWGVGLLVAFAACGDDATAPDVEAEVRVERARFFPASVVVSPGAKVRWVNILPRSAENERTVTSGTGPDDPESGAVFDSGVLRGFPSGEARGESFTFEFRERGTYPYYSRLPEGAEFTGTVVVQ